MKTYTVTKREGELLGPIDWTFNFRGAFDNQCTSDANRDAACERAKARLKEVEDGMAAGKRYRVLVSEWWHTVYSVGMYDGWPFWKPYPSFRVSEDVLGGTTWEPFYNINAVEELP